jgi:hypothetical protein
MRGEESPGSGKSADSQPEQNRTKSDHILVWKVSSCSRQTNAYGCKQSEANLIKASVWPLFPM